MMEDDVWVVHILGRRRRNATTAKWTYPPHHRQLRLQDGREQWRVISVQEGLAGHSIRPHFNAMYTY